MAITSINLMHFTAQQAILVVPGIHDDFMMFLILQNTFDVKIDVSKLEMQIHYKEYMVLSSFIANTLVFSLFQCFCVICLTHIKYTVETFLLFSEKSIL